MIGHLPTASFLLKKFSYVSFSSNATYKSNRYIDPSMNRISTSTHVLDVGISMPSNSTFYLHISDVYRRCSNLAGGKLRTYTMGDPI